MYERKINNELLCFLYTLIKNIGKYSNDIKIILI